VRRTLARDPAGPAFLIAASLSGNQSRIISRP
jgi:hypothetical protein